jgi:uncharacterized protein (DUF305 family)
MNYKISTIVLALIIVVTYSLHWKDIFNHKAPEMNTMQGMHQMPDGSMMMNHGGSMDMMDMTMADMVSMMNGKTGKALEKEFITGMIPHHQGAVDMSKRLLQDQTISPEMKKFAEGIITTQESEIQMMNKWLENY